MITRKTTLALAAAVLLVPLTAFAQYRVGADGQALDSNNRIGSNGFNSNTEPSSYVNGNLIVTGNVTNAKSFRGQVPYKAPSEFRGNVAGQGVDDFIRDSSGVPMRGQAQPNYLDVPRPFYGVATTVAPPQGYVLKPLTPAYTPENVGLNPGAVDLNYNLPPSVMTQLPSPNEKVLIGAPGAGPIPSFMVAGENNQIQPWQPNGENQYFISRTAEVPVVAAQPTLTPAAIQQMRQELNRTTAPETGSPPGTTASVLGNPPGVSTSGAALNPGAAAPQPNNLNQPPAPGQIPGQLPNNLNAPALPAQPLNVPLPTGVQTQENVGFISIAPPEKQSSQIDQLQQRMQQLVEPKIPTPENPANPAAPETKKPLSPSDYASPPATQPARNLTIPQGHAPQPMKIESLGTGVHAQGLKTLLTDAEDLMRQGKFSSAIGKYQTAEQVAPNNAMVLLGLAHAELGGGFFERADVDLHRAIFAEPSLSLAQYNLKTVYGEQRLQKLIDDLKQLGTMDKANPRPLFLLAYIAYNVGNDPKAADYLNAADQRAGGKDAVINVLKKTWKLQG